LRDTGFAQCEQHLPFRAELEQLESAALRRRIVLERSAVAGPEIAVAVLTESVRLHEHATAESLVYRARCVDVEDGRLGSMMQPRAAFPVGDDPDCSAWLDVAELR